MDIISDIKRLIHRCAKYTLASVFLQTLISSLKKPQGKKTKVIICERCFVWCLEGASHKLRDFYLSEDLFIVVFLSYLFLENLPQLRNQENLNSIKVFQGKVEKILKDRLDSIPSPSPSVKKSNYGVGSFLELYRQNIKKFVDITQQCFALLPKVNFQPII